ncbi:hypothetical protein GOB94_14015 [Granulicella sp. 5B5]|uniref:hypothetical protein n=1 Tax=Granulicella sp. 5B5 TaxID=1617967 RepID=UPI0015F5B849|nr:hypothetical protein [Granulicella sp. 5B5]QMV19681.1 hypothetical protein GOB94_14015 [Granulicella sp. 5B5]
MQKVKDITWIVAAALLIACAVSVTIFVCLRLHQLGKDETVLVSGVQASLNTINAGCMGRVGGTLCVVNEDLLDAGNLIDRSAYVMKREQSFLDKTLPGLTTQLLGSLMKVDVAAGDLDPLLKSVTMRVDALGPIESNLADASSAATKGVNDFDARVNSQEVTNALNAGSKAALFFADTSKHVDSMTTTADAVETKISAPFLNPKPKHWYDYIKPSWELLWQAGMLAK